MKETKEQLQELIQGIIWDELNFFVMIRNLDDQYQKVLDEVVSMSSIRILEELKNKL